MNYARTAILLAACPAYLWRFATYVLGRLCTERPYVLSALCTERPYVLSGPMY